MKRTKNKSDNRIKQGILVLVLILLVNLFLFHRLDRLNNPKIYPQGKANPTLTDRETFQSAIADVYYVPDYEGENALLIQNSFKGRYVFASPGETRFLLPDNLRKIEFDPGLVKNKVQIMKEDPLGGEIISFKVLGDNLYFTTYRSNELEPRSTSLYQLNLKTNQKKLIWKNILDSEKYLDAHGAVYIESISLPYVAMKKTNCTQCEGSFAGVLVLNMDTKKEIYLQRAGNVVFDLKDKGFNYQSFMPKDIPCEGGVNPFCPNGTARVYEPAGDFFFERLP